MEGRTVWGRMRDDGGGIVQLGWGGAGLDRCGAGLNRDLNRDLSGAEQVG